MELTKQVHFAGKPTSQIGDFFQQLTETPQRLLLLDYDGTLAPFRVNPIDATPYQGVRDVLNDIMADGLTRVVVISGRPARQLPLLLGLQITPEIWGCQGWDHLSPDGEYRCGPIDLAALRTVMQDTSWMRDIQMAGGRVEQKACGFAIHWRGLSVDQIEEVANLARQHWAALKPQRLIYEEFDGGVEWRVPGRNKGDVVLAVLKQQPQALAAYLGDDISDEDAFRVLQGRGLGVLVSTTDRPTSADWWIRPPEQVLDFLLVWREFSRRSLREHSP